MIVLSITELLLSPIDCFVKTLLMRRQCHWYLTTVEVYQQSFSTAYCCFSTSKFCIDIFGVSVFDWGLGSYRVAQHKHRAKILDSWMLKRQLPHDTLVVYIKHVKHTTVKVDAVYIPCPGDERLQYSTSCLVLSFQIICDKHKKCFLS